VDTVNAHNVRGSAILWIGYLERKCNVTNQYNDGRFSLRTAGFLIEFCILVSAGALCYLFYNRIITMNEALHFLGLR